MTVVMASIQAHAAKRRDISATAAKQSEWVPLSETIQEGELQLTSTCLHCAAVCGTILNVSKSAPQSRTLCWNGDLMNASSHSENSHRQTCH